MDGIELTSQGLTALVNSFTQNFFPPILDTVEALAPWIVAVAGAVAAYRLIKRFLGKTMQVGGDRLGPSRRRIMSYQKGYISKYGMSDRKAKEWARLDEFGMPK